MVNRRAIRCGAQGCRYSSGHWRAKKVSPPRVVSYKNGASVSGEIGAPFLCLGTENGE